MIEEVNKIIYNLILSRRGVFLPSVGSLGVEFVSASMPSFKEIVPPHNTVVFSSAQMGVSLTDEIMRIAGCTTAEAQDIYDRWLSKTYKDEELTIESVGKLKFKNFILDPTFDAVLNPSGCTGRKITPSSRMWPVVVGIFAVCAVVLCGAVWWFYFDSRFLGENHVDYAAVVAAEPEPNSRAVTSGVDMTDSISGETFGREVKNVEATTEDNGAVRGTEPGVYYVVFGLFSTEENARRAVADAQKTDSSVVFSIYSAYGNKFLISVFENSDRELCADFIRKNSGRLGDLWPYTQK